MTARRWTFTLLALLVFLALLAGSTRGAPVYASPAPQEEGPGSLLPQPGQAAPEVNPAAAPATPGINYLTYHSLLFKPVLGKTDWEYSFSYGTIHMLTTTVLGQFVVPLSLPDGVAVREITFYFRDNNASSDLEMGLCRVTIGGNAGGCLGWTVNASGVNTTALVDRTLAGSPILTIDNANYSYFLAVVIPVANPQFGIVSARIGYAASTFLPEIHR